MSIQRRAARAYRGRTVSLKLEKEREKRGGGAPSSRRFWEREGSKRENVSKRCGKKGRVTRSGRGGLL
jgi:hypothetical protein